MSTKIEMKNLKNPVFTYPNKATSIKDAFVVAFSRPGRIEISLTNSGEIVAFVYEGAEFDVEADPIGGYDSLYGKNDSWNVEKE